MGLARGDWSPALTEDQIERTQETLGNSPEAESTMPWLSLLMIAFHSRSIFPDDELARRLIAGASFTHERGLERETRGIEQMLEQLGETGPEKQRQWRRHKQEK
jgi:hypothetical protein